MEFSRKKDGALKKKSELNEAHTICEWRESVLGLFKFKIVEDRERS